MAPAVQGRRVAGKTNDSQLRFRTFSNQAFPTAQGAAQLRIKQIVFAVLLMLLGSSVARAAVLVTNDDGILLGARGVEILGGHYDVSFERGLCSDFYGDCGPTGPYRMLSGLPDPDKLMFAEQASYALFDQVLVGDYDLDAGLTNGCQSFLEFTVGRCYILTPYWWSDSIRGASSQLVYMVAVNGSVLPVEAVFEPVFVLSNQDLVLSSDNMGNRHPTALTEGGIDPRSAASVWAVWKPSVPVPEPAAVALFSIGLFGLVLSRRRLTMRHEMRI